MVQALQAGQLDLVMAGNDGTSVQAALAGGAKLYWATVGQLVYLLHVNGKPASPLTNPLVDQALNYAIDRDALNQVLFQGYGKPTSEYVTTDGFDPKYQNYYKYDPAKAKALLAQAG